jgi:hypothetical protein
MNELLINLHMHTPYSDGFGSHNDIAQAALRAGLDVVIVTDHNVYVEGPEDYYRPEGATSDKRKVLLLVGEEIHDQARQPQKSHLLALGAGKELAPLAHDPQILIDSVRQAGGLAFLAHPVDPAAPAIHQDDLSWVDWHVHGYTGIELWNGFSELKVRVKNRLQAFFYVYFPQYIARGPQPEALQKWDELLVNGQRVVAIGGSDAHAIPVRLGPLRRIVFPYEWHFRGVNTHLLTPTPLTGDLAADRRMIYDALAKGRCFIGYDLPASTRSFRFTANSLDGTATMGDEISSAKGITFQIRLPRPAECRLIKDGKTIKTWSKRETCMHITTEAGVYRVEVYIEYLGRLRGWIYSNPIFVK